MIDLFLWKESNSYCSEVSIKWHKIIISFALNQGHKQISATWKMKIKWSLTSQSHALYHLSETLGLYNLHVSLDPLGIFLYCYLLYALISLKQPEGKNQVY